MDSLFDPTQESGRFYPFTEDLVRLGVRDGSEWVKVSELSTEMFVVSPVAVGMRDGRVVFLVVPRGNNYYVYNAHRALVKYKGRTPQSLDEVRSALVRVGIDPSAGKILGVSPAKEEPEPDEADGVCEEEGLAGVSDSDVVEIIVGLANLLRKRSADNETL